MPSRIPFYLLVLVLISIGILSIYQRHSQSGIPLTVGEQVDIWKVEAQIEFTGTGKPVVARFSLPKGQQFEVINEYTASPAYGVMIRRNNDLSEILWSKRFAEGPQTLYYQAAFREKLVQLTPPSPPPPMPEYESWQDPYQKSAQFLFDDAFEMSGDHKSLAWHLFNSLSTDNQHAALILAEFSKIDALSHLLKMAEIPHFIVKGLVLEDGRRKQQLIPLLKLYVNQQWFVFDVNAGQLTEGNHILLWQEDQPSLLDLEGGTNSKVYFSISQDQQSALQQAKQYTESSRLMDFDLYSLPLAEQNMFKGILLLPVGVLVVVFLRVMVGIRCSGTFMPVLIATSFIQTTLINGLVGFLAIVAAGLLIRSYLSRLNLLLVSRISAVVIMVIGIIVLFTIVAFQMGLTQALTITFFPMIILAWTIERMSILWEEEGPKEVLIQGSGSLIVAVIAYLMMDDALIRHWVFNFLGIHFIIMALVLLMGQYTGYRLLELRRFSPLAISKAKE